MRTIALSIVLGSLVCLGSNALSDYVIENKLDEKPQPQFLTEPTIIERNEK